MAANFFSLAYIVKKKQIEEHNTNRKKESSLFEYIWGLHEK